MKRLALILALVLLWTGVDARPLVGSGGNPPAVSDNISALLATMSSKQVVQLSNALCCSDILARTNANFDGSSNNQSTFLNNVSATIGAGSSANPQQMSFSRMACDPTRITTIPCVWWGGGHTDYGDGSVYTLNINTAAGFVLAHGSPASHTILAPSCRYIPATVSTGVETGMGVANPTVTTTAASTSNVITTSAAIVDLGFGGNTFIGGTGVPDYTYVSSGLGTTTLTLSGNVNVANGATISYNSMKWCAPNSLGNWVPLAAHSYNCNAILSGASTAVLGGPYPWGTLGTGQPGGNSGTINLSTGIATPYSDTNNYGMCLSLSTENATLVPNRNAADQHWYVYALFGTGTFARCGNSVPISCPTSLLTLTSTGMTSATNEVVADPSPLLGSGHQAYFGEMTSAGCGGSCPGDFLYIDDIANSPSCGTRQGSGNPYPPCFGTFTNDLFINGSTSGGGASQPAYRTVTYDGTHFVVWDIGCAFGGSSSPCSTQLVDITINNTSPITATMTVEVPTTGNLPQTIVAANVPGVQACTMIYDLGSTYGHAKLLDNCGTLYLEKH